MIHQAGERQVTLAQPYPLSSPHSQSETEVLIAYGSNAETGLSEVEVAQRSSRYGSNELALTAPEFWWKRFSRQFADLLIWILIGAALLSGVLKEWIDAIAILGIVL